LVQLWSRTRLGVGCYSFDVAATRAYSHLVVSEFYLGWEDQSVEITAYYFSDVGSE